MINPKEWDISEQVLGGTGVGLGILMGLQKMMSFWKSEGVTQASADANAKQFKAFQESIDSINKELTAVRAEVSVMDRTIHKQQRTITRTEMLLRQLSSLVQQHGITVPIYMQEELDELLNPEPQEQP